ncbi:MAG: S8 family serine peptidase [Bacteroidales bacterium]
MNCRLIFLFVGICWSLIPANAQIAPGKYVAWLTDKDNNLYSLSNPSAFLSQRSLERRQRQGIALDWYDLPVTPSYISQIKAVGVHVIHASKWLNFVVFETSNPALADQVALLPFVKKVEKARKRPVNRMINSGTQDYMAFPWMEALLLTNTTELKNSKGFDYGGAANQVQMIKTDVLHNLGYTGKGMLIALLDAGYASADQLPALDSLFKTGRMLGTRDFVLPGNNVFDPAINGHGTMVLSTMAALQPGTLVGTAPRASYFLIRTEDAQSEYVIEEYNWVSGAELADSLGADVINSSLGYTEFDDPAQNHTYQQMDGNTAISTLGADRAASRGMLVVSSAGNSGSSPWRHIGAPADGDSVFTIGAVDALGNYASFSSQGPSYDGRIKPNIATQGQGAAFIGPWGGLSYGNGTSFSSPIAAGSMACLWQAHPDLNNMQLMQIVMETASQANNPDSLLGYGIPDFSAAHSNLSAGQNELTNSDYFIMAPNPFHAEVVIRSTQPVTKTLNVELFDLKGIRQRMSTWWPGSQYLTWDGLQSLPQGMYILRINSATSSNYYRLIKE